MAVCQAALWSCSAVLLLWAQPGKSWLAPLFLQLHMGFHPPLGWPSLPLPGKFCAACWNPCSWPTSDPAPQLFSAWHRLIRFKEQRYRFYIPHVIRSVSSYGLVFSLPQLQTLECRRCLSCAVLFLWKLTWSTCDAEHGTHMYHGSAPDSTIDEVQTHFNFSLVTVASEIILFFISFET